MALTQASWVDRVLGQVLALNPNASPTLKDDLNRMANDALLSLGEIVSDSPLRHMLKRDFAVQCTAGSCDLTTATLSNGGSLASGNVLAIIFESIRKGKALHPDSLEPLQWSGGSAAFIDKGLAFFTSDYLVAGLSGNAIYIRKGDGTTPSDQLVIFKSSFAPLFSFFSSSTNADTPTLEDKLVSIGVRLAMPQTATAAPGQPA